MLTTLVKWLVSLHLSERCMCSQLWTCSLQGGSGAQLQAGGAYKEREWEPSFQFWDSGQITHRIFKSLSTCQTRSATCTCRLDTQIHHFFSVWIIFLNTKKWQRNRQKSKLLLSKSLLRHQSIIKDSTPIADCIPGTEEPPSRQRWKTG